MDDVNLLMQYVYGIIWSYWSNPVFFAPLYVSDSCSPVRQSGVWNVMAAHPSAFVFPHLGVVEAFFCLFLAELVVYT